MIDHAFGLLGYSLVFAYELMFGLEKVGRKCFSLILVSLHSEIIQSK